MPHRSDTWTDASFIYPLHHVNFLTSFIEWFRFFFNGVTVKTENRTATGWPRPLNRGGRLIQVTNAAFI